MRRIASGRFKNPVVDFSHKNVEIQLQRLSFVRNLSHNAEL